LGLEATKSFSEVLTEFETKYGDVAKGASKGVVEKLKTDIQNATDVNSQDMVDKLQNTASGESTIPQKAFEETTKMQKVKKILEDLQKEKDNLEYGKNLGVPIDEARLKSITQKIKMYLKTYNLSKIGYANGIENGAVTQTGLAMLHGSPSKPEFVLNYSQMVNFIRNMAKSSLASLSSIPNLNLASANASGSGDISLSINIEGNADKSTVSQLKSAGTNILNEIKKTLNKNGTYR
jgi:polyhydroxyalkanoate synthesis regulator phasin